jgi:alpha-mannosidase
VPEHAGDINPWGVGCYTSQVRVKQAYRALENELFVTEKMASAAAFQNVMPYPAEALASAERGMAWTQFHDILPGSSAPVVEEDTLRSIAHARETRPCRAHAFFALASGVPARVPARFPSWSTIRIRIRSMP